MSADSSPYREPLHEELRRIEHYALYIINGMAAGGSGSLTDSDIDYAIDVAERLANRLLERGHIHPGQ
nr:hypothetical protein [uncultured Holophaga sp.]